MKLEQFLKELEHYSNSKAFVGSMNQSVALVEREAKIKCPVDTGNLRRSIASDVKSSGNTITGEVFTNLDYAPYVEYGTGLFAERGDGRLDVPWKYQDDKGNWHTTSGQEPQPFMRPAIDDNLLQIESIFAKEAFNLGKREEIISQLLE